MNILCVCVCFLFFWSTQTDTRSRLLAFETFCSWLSLIYKIKKEKWEKRNMHSNVVVCSVMSDSLQSHELQHARPPCPSPSPWVCSNSCPLSWWFHPTISSSVASFSSCPQPSPASGSFPMSQLFTTGSQSIEASASASVLPVNIQDWFPLGWTGLISLLSRGLSRVFSSTQFKSISSLVLSLLYGPILISIQDYWKNHSFD